MISILVFFLTSLIIFIALASATISRKLNAAERNLQRIEDKRAYNTIDEQNLKDDLSTRMKIFFEGKVDSLLLENQEKTKTDILSKMVAKVYGKKKTYKEWEYERITAGVLSFALGLFAFVLFKMPLVLIVSILLPILIYVLYETDLKSKAKDKDWENFIFFPEFLMNLCMLYKVGAISSIFQGFATLCKTYEHPLVDEIKAAVKEYDFNKDKYDTLNDLSERVDFKEFTSFINLVIESEKNNIPIAESLTEYAFEISSKRKILASNQILKLPEKMDLVMYLTSTPICFVYMIMPSLSVAVSQLSGSGVL